MKEKPVSGRTFINSKLCRQIVLCQKHSRTYTKWHKTEMKLRINHNFMLLPQINYVRRHFVPRMRVLPLFYEQAQSFLLCCFMLCVVIVLAKRPKTFQQFYFEDLCKQHYVLHKQYCEAKAGTLAA